MEDLDEIVREFLVESYENLDQLDRDLVALEESPGSRQLLGSIFRTIHTIKGTSGFLAFGRLERVTHVGENLLVELRDGKRSMDQRTTDVLLRMTDCVRDILTHIESDGTEGEVPIDPVIEEVDAIRNAGAAAEAPSVAGAAEAPSVAGAAEAPSVAGAAPTATAAAGGGTTVVVEAPVQTIAPAAVKPADTPVVPTQTPAPAAENIPDDAAGARGAADTSIRVDVDLLDALMRQVGELVLARNQISRLASGTQDVDLSQSAQRLSLIASELQEGVMKTRMQPIEHLWSKMPRLVRDVAAACQREVQLEMTGGETELDRGLLEAVKDPLTHLVRNAVDHGIEPSDERVAAGKPAKGVLTLRAYHSGSQVVVEVADDGRGVDPEKVAAKALEKGLRTIEQLDAASDADLLQLLFLPGFSTAAKVTNVSGRGVGMDVVRTKVEAIGGTVDIESTLGAGTVWRLRIPLTLAIMNALTVETAGDLYAVPQLNLIELVAPDGQRSGSGIEYVHSAPVYRLRGDLLPLVSLAGVLGVEQGSRDEERTGVIAVVQSDQQRFGLLLDRVLNTEEIVVKPLATQLRSIGVYAGATVLGDGRVALILDVAAIARRAVVGDLDQAGSEARRRAQADTAQTFDEEQMLVVGVGGRRVAMPLASVARLEHLREDSFETVGGREVVQYRDSILPLARVDRLVGAPPLTPVDGELLVVVFTQGGRSAGLVVEEILDIVDDEVAHHCDIEDRGLLGSAVLGNRVTELLDTRAAILTADPSFFDVLVGASA